MRRAAALMPTAIVLAALFGAEGARAQVKEGFRLDAMPEGGISVNGDQWVVGGAARLGGACLVACARNLGFSVEALTGLGGNHVTFRGSARFDYVLWLADEGTVGLYPAAGVSLMGFVPVGGFARFCHRVDLDGCGGTFVAPELGGGLRLWPVTLQAVVSFGELPVATVTASYRLRVWEQKR